MKPKRIAIIKLSSLGDIVHTLPAFHLLRERFPRSKISWIVEPAGAKLLRNFSGIDEIIEINLKVPGFFNKIREIIGVLSKYRRTFDLIFDFQGLLKSAILAYLLKSEVVGFHRVNLREPQARFYYDRSAPVFDESNHVIFKNIHLARGQVSSFDIDEQEKNTQPIRNEGKRNEASREFTISRSSQEALTPAPIGDGFMLPVDKDLPPKYPPIKDVPAGEDLKHFLTANKLAERNFFIVNVGGGWETKLLTASQNIDIVNRLKSKFKKKYKTVILWGNEKEKKTAGKISARTGAILAPFLNFSDLIRFIKSSRLIITGDTLPMHIADMVAVPSVGIFGPTNPLRNGSLLASSQAVYKKLPCSFCYKKKCGTIRCIRKLDIEKIIRAVEHIDEKCS